MAHMALLLLALMVIAPNALYMLLLQFQQRQKRLTRRPYAYAALEDGSEDMDHETRALMALRTLWVSDQLKKRGSSPGVACPFRQPPGTDTETCHACPWQASA